MVFAPWFINRYTPPANYLLAFFRQFPEVFLLRFEKHSFQLRILVLKCKVQMPRIGLAQVGNLPRDSNKREFRLQDASDGFG
ncbi:MAG: hypothetical protein AMJ61_06890 [Desulfobacterales bacterium SG8_35_2]|nr:MAG: hypothetical protein AMJ61_06890 [Desulfobacterales bacterium SG8_35_2]